jgi:hypothetical protein
MNAVASSSGARNSDGQGCIVVESQVVAEPMESAHEFGVDWFHLVLRVK